MLFLLSDSLESIWFCHEKCSASPYVPVSVLTLPWGNSGARARAALGLGDSCHYQQLANPGCKEYRKAVTVGTWLDLEGNKNFLLLVWLKNIIQIHSGHRVMCRQLCVYTQEAHTCKNAQTLNKYICIVKIIFLPLYYTLYAHKHKQNGSALGACLWFRTNRR